MKKCGGRGQQKFPCAHEKGSILTCVFSRKKYLAQDCNISRVPKSTMCGFGRMRQVKGISFQNTGCSGGKGALSFNNLRTILSEVEELPAPRKKTCTWLWA